MTTGALFNGRCYSSIQEAADAYYTSAPPSFTAGSTSYLGQYVKDSGLWMLNQYSISSTGIVTQLGTAQMPTFAFPTCDPMQEFSDGMLIGWGMAGIMIAVWALVQIKRGL